MSQLVGLECVICRVRITDATVAKFCDGCGNPVHTQCQRSFAATASGCEKCGGDPASAPGDLPVRRSHTGLVVAAVALLAAIGGAVSVLVPTGKPRAGAKPSTSGVSDMATPVTGNVSVEIATTLGTIRANLFADRAPKTVANFVDLVNQKFYDGIVFHRVIKDFMVQTGDPKGDGTGGRTDKGMPHVVLRDEFHPELRHNKAGILSMANAGPNTGDTQFFITCVPTAWLDDKHAIFGEVVDGMEVVHKIENVPTGRNDRPRDPVKIITARVIAP